MSHKSVAWRSRTKRVPPNDYLMLVDPWMELKDDDPEELNVEKLSKLTASYSRSRQELMQ